MSLEYFRQQQHVAVEIDPQTDDCFSLTPVLKTLLVEFLKGIRQGGLENGSATARYNL
jgi:hypothetical protein